MADQTWDPDAHSAPTNDEIEQHLLHVMVPEALERAALVLVDGEEAQDHERRRASIDRAAELIRFAVHTIQACALYGPTDRRQESYAYAVRVEELSKRLKELILLQISVAGP